MKRTIIALSAALTVSAVTVGATVSPAQAGTIRPRGSHVDRIAHAGPPLSEAEVPTDLLASLLIERASAPPPTPREPDSLTPKIYAVMALTSLFTFATLTTGYQLFFSHQLFA